MIALNVQMDILMIQKYINVCNARKIVKLVNQLLSVPNAKESFKQFFFKVFRYFLNLAEECSPCIDNCDECDSSTTCTKCVVGFYLN